MSNVVKKVVKKAGRAVGVSPKKKAAAAIAPKPAPIEKAPTEPVMAERAQRAEAARRRGRRVGRRGLMMAGRLGGGGQEEETKTTLGA